MVNSLQRDALYLKLLAQTKTPRQRNKLIDSAPPHVIGTLSDCAHNVLRGNVKISKNQLSKLKRHKTELRHLSKRRGVSINKRRKILQKGGLLPALIGPLLSILPALVKTAIR